MTSIRLCMSTMSSVTPLAAKRWLDPRWDAPTATAPTRIVRTSKATVGSGPDKRGRTDLS